MHPYFYPALEAAPTIFERLIHRIPESAHHTPTHPGRFTPLEVIAHQADWEPILRGRMEEAVRNPGGQVFGMDEVERARDQRYSERNIEAEIENFRVERSKTIAWLQSLSPDQFLLTVTHNEKGLLTVSEQADMLVGHDTYHTLQLVEVLP